MVRLKQRYILFSILYPPTSGNLVSPELFRRYSDSPEDAFLALHQSSPSQITQKSILQSVRKVILEVYGEYGAGTAGGLLQLKYFSNKTSTGILRCGRLNYQMVIAALALMNRLEDRDVIITGVHVSGTIKKCEQFSIRRNKEMIILLSRRRKERRDLNGVISSLENDNVEMSKVTDGEQEEG